MTASEIRRRARFSIGDNWVSLVAIYWLYNILTGLLGSFVSLGSIMLVFGAVYNKIKKHIYKFLKELIKNLEPEMEKIFIESFGKNYMEELYANIINLGEIFVEILPVIIVIVIVSVALYVIGTSILNAGLYKMYIDCVRGKDVSFTTLFKSVKVWPKMCGISILKNIINTTIVIVGIIIAIMLSKISILLTIIIAILSLVTMFIISYMFIFAPYYILDNSNIGVIESMKSSCKITSGHKGKLVILHFSFIGWSIVASIASSVISGILPILMNIPIYLLNIYIWIAFTHYYIHLIGQDIGISFEKQLNYQNVSYLNNQTNYQDINQINNSINNQIGEINNQDDKVFNQDVNQIEQNTSKDENKEN